MRLLSLAVVLALAMFMMPAATAAPKTHCHDEGRFRVIARPADGVGTDFIIKQRSRGRSIPPCKYIPRPGDFEIRNEDAEYFLGLEGNFLVLDSGTSPEPRGLVVWDLEKRRKVYTGRYASPVKIDAEGVSFWQETGPATDANCSQAALWRSQGLGAALETEVRLGFADLVVVPGAATRCSARQ